ncbi:MAG TPA: DEAD/DEAH box helicase, partial [Chitinophagaceae bacterium]
MCSAERLKHTVDLKILQGILKAHWSYDSFRGVQESVISSVMKQNDTLAVMPTGGGKSICYQVPALAMDG